MILIMDTNKIRTIYESDPVSAGSNGFNDIQYDGLNTSGGEDVSDYSDMYSYSYGAGDYSYGGSEYMEFDITDALSLYVSPVVLGVGIIGNILNVIVLLSLASSHLSSCVYLAVLAIIDTLQLCISLGNTWFMQVFGTDVTSFILTRSNVSCQVYSFVVSIVNMSNWLLVVTLMEMCLVSYQPAKAHRICIKERSKNIILVLILFLICVNAHFFWTYGIAKQQWAEGHMTTCTFTPQGSHYSEHFRSLVWPIMDLLVSLLLPDLIILLLLIFIYKKSGFHGNNIDQVLLTNHFLLDPSALLNFKRTSLVLGVLCIISSLPECGYNIFEFVLEKRDEATGAPQNYDVKFYGQRALAQTLTSTCRDIFLAFKVFVYCMTWSQFRKRLIFTLSCGYCRKKPAKLKGMTDDTRKVSSTNGCDNASLYHRDSFIVPEHDGAFELSVLNGGQNVNLSFLPNGGYTSVVSTDFESQEESNMNRFSATALGYHGYIPSTITEV